MVDPYYTSFDLLTYILAVPAYRYPVTALGEFVAKEI